MGTSLCCPERDRKVNDEEAYEPFDPDELVYGEGYAGSLHPATKLDFTSTPSEQASVAGSYKPPTVGRDRVTSGAATVRDRLVSGNRILPISSKRRHNKRKSSKKKKKKRKSQPKKGNEADRARSYHHKISMDAISGESLYLDDDLSHPKYATYPPPDDRERRMSNSSDNLRITEMLSPDNPTLIADLVDLERTERVKSFSKSRHEQLSPSSVKTTLLEVNSMTPDPEASIIESLPSVTISVLTEDHTSVGSNELANDMDFVDYNEARVQTEDEYHRRQEAPSYTTRKRMSEHNLRRKGTLEQLYDTNNESLPWLTQLVKEEVVDSRPRMSAISEARLNAGALGPSPSNSLDQLVHGSTGGSGLLAKSHLSTGSNLSVASSATAPYGDLRQPTIEADDLIGTGPLYAEEEPVGRGRAIASSRYVGRRVSAPGDDMGRRKRSKKKKKKRGRRVSAPAFHRMGLP